MFRGDNFTWFRMCSENGCLDSATEILVRHITCLDKQFIISFNYRKYKFL